MSLLTTCIVDDLDVIADIEYLKCEIASNLALVTDAPPDFAGGKSLSPAIGTAYIPTFTNQTGNTLYIAFNFKYTSATASYVFQINDGSKGIQVSLVLLPTDYKLRAYTGPNGATLLGTGTKVFSLNTWYSLRAEVKINNTTGVFKVYIDGDTNADISVSNVDTQYQTSADVYWITFTGFYGYIHQVIVFNNLGTVNNTMVPWGIRHEILYPTGDGATTWTPTGEATTWAAIDELQGAPDDDTKYTASSTLNAKNIVSLENPTGNIGTVAGIVVNSRIRRTASGGVGVKVGTKVSTDEYQSSEFLLPISYTNYIHNIEYKTGTTQFVAADLTNLELTTEITNLP